MVPDPVDETLYLRYFRLMREVRAMVALKPLDMAEHTELRPEHFAFCFSHGGWALKQHLTLYSGDLPVTPVDTMLWIFDSDEAACECLATHRRDLLQETHVMKEATLQAVLDAILADVRQETLGSSVITGKAQQLLESHVERLVSQADAFACSRTSSKLLDAAGRCLLLLYRLGNLISTVSVSIAAPPSRPDRAQTGGMPAFCTVAAASEHVNRLYALRTAAAPVPAPAAGGSRAHAPPLASWHPTLAARMTQLLEVARAVHEKLGMNRPIELHDDTCEGYTMKEEEKQEREAMEEAMFGRFRCAACGVRPQGRKDHKLCSRCQGVHYCGADCQRAHWKEHKATCTPRQPAAVAGAQG